MIGNNNPSLVEPIQNLTIPTNLGNVFNYSEYFIVRLKEYLMKMPTKNKLLFVLKIFLLLNWERMCLFVYKIVRKYYALKIKRYFPRLSFYKTTIKRIEPAIASSKLPQIAYKYINDKSLLVQHYRENDPNDNVYVIDKDGVEFDYDGVHYYCYTDIKEKQACSSNKNLCEYVIECSSNYSYDETVTRVNKMFENFKPHDVYIHDSSMMDLPRCTAIKIDRTMDNIFLQEDIEKEIKNFVSKYDELKDEYKKLGILFKNTFLVYGEPGTGKSTLAKVIANELKRDIVLSNLKEINNVKQLQYLIHKHKNAVIVFEELDCLIERIKTRKKQSKSMDKIKNKSIDDKIKNESQINVLKNDNLELSDFLEILDGMRSTEDSIIFFTTNYIDKIDPAFKRQGRINYLLEMKLCNKYQFAKIYQSILKRDIPNDILINFIEYKYSPSNIIETILKNIFELRDGIISDMDLFKLISINHQNFMATNINICSIRET